MIRKKILVVLLATLAILPFLGDKVFATQENSELARLYFNVNINAYGGCYGYPYGYYGYPYYRGYCDPYFYYPYTAPYPHAYPPPPFWVW